MLDIGGQSQEGVWGCTDAIVLEFADEEEDFAAALPVVDVALTGRCMISGCTLALPMEERFVNGVVVVHCRWRVVLIRLIQGNEEHVDFLLG